MYSFSFFYFFFRCIERVLRHRKKKMEREYSITRRPAQFPLLLHEQQEENLRPRRQIRIFPPHFLDPVFTPYKAEGIRRDKFSTRSPTHFFSFSLFFRFPLLFSFFFFFFFRFVLRSLFPSLSSLRTSLATATAHSQPC